MVASSLRLITQATVTTSPITGESPKETVNTIVRGMPGDSGVTVVTMLVCFFHLHMRPRAHRASGIPCALMFSQGQTSGKPRARARRDRGATPVIFTVDIASSNAIEL
jgi:hypothetical protein